MRGNWLILTAVLAVAPVAASCAGMQSAGQELDDDVITTRVASRLAADPDVKKHQVDVDTINGIVTLRGEVPNQLAKTEAEEIALNTEGVLGVRNQLEVHKESMGEKTEEVFGDAWIKTKVGSQLAADPDILRPFANATGGAVFMTGEDGRRLPEIRRIDRGANAGGNDWIGIERNGAYVVRAARASPLGPGWLWAVIGIALISSTGISKKPWICPAWRSTVSTRSAPAWPISLATSRAVIGTRGWSFLSVRP